MSDRAGSSRGSPAPHQSARPAPLRQPGPVSLDEGSVVRRPHCRRGCAGSLEHSFEVPSLPPMSYVLSAPTGIGHVSAGRWTLAAQCHRGHGAVAVASKSEAQRPDSGLQRRSRFRSLRVRSSLVRWCSNDVHPIRPRRTPLRRRVPRAPRLSSPASALLCPAHFTVDPLRPSELPGYAASTHRGAVST